MITEQDDAQQNANDRDISSWTKNQFSEFFIRFFRQIIAIRKIAISGAPSSPVPPRIEA